MSIITPSQLSYASFGAQPVNSQNAAVYRGTLGFMGINPDSPHKRKIAIITGASGTTTPYLSRALEEQGYTVYGGRRAREGEASGLSDKTIRYTEDELTNEIYWKTLLESQNGGDLVSEVILVNAIGQPRAPKGKTLDDVNVRPVVALAKGGKAFADENPNIKVAVVQLSAIAAKYLHDTYGESRKRAEDLVVEEGETGPSNFNAIALQMPFIYATPRLDDDGKTHIEGLQPWSMEQVAQLGIVPLPGSGNQPLRPLSPEDMGRAVARANEYAKSGVIEAMGADTVTQKELIQLYADLADRRVVIVPTGRLTPILPPFLDTFHYGLLDGYAPRTMSEMEGAEYDDGDFTELLGRQPEGIKSAHEDLDATTTILAPPPIGAHMQANAGKIKAVVAGTLTGLAALAYAIKGQ